MAIAAVISRLVSAPTTPRLLTLTFADASKMSGLSVSYLRKLAQRQRLVTTKIGRKRLVSYESLQNLVK